MKTAKRSTILVLLAALALTPSAHALENIIRPFQTTRTMSMGGVKHTTGLYDENFNGNPARATANPKWKLQLLDLYAETNSTSLGTIGTLLGGGEPLTNLASSAGDINHVRFGGTLFGIHIPREKMSYSFGLQFSAQADVGLRRNYQVDPQTIVDLGPALTVARKLLDDDRLSVGATAHFAYRISSPAGFSILDILKGKSISPLDGGGEGGHIDLDIGGTYELPWKPLEFDLSAALTMSNVLGGGYNQFDMGLVGGTNAPYDQKRALGLGVSARKPELWKFTDFVVALEASDIGNNNNGSFWKWFHIGSEAKWKLISIRAGVNQGYLGGGLGFDLKFLQLDAGTWGEEYSLNVGGLQNRILAFRLGFNI